MSKLNFKEAKTFFRSAEEAVCYFILVESYEKCLDGDEKKSFLEAKSIDDMLDLLEDKQLAHLKSLIELIKKYKIGAFNQDDQCRYGTDAFSDWFTKNLLIYRKRAGLKDESKFIIRIRELCTEIINKIDSMERMRKFVKKEENQIIKNYKSNLVKFNGDSNEYRKWIILTCLDRNITEISRSRDIDKILKNLSTKTLKGIKEELKSKFSDKDLKDLIKQSERYEPYFYKFDLEENPRKTSNFTIENEHFTGFKGFKRVIKDLFNQVEEILKKREEMSLFEDKIDKLKTSTRFYEDIYDLLHSLDINLNDHDLKRAIGEYSKVGVQGEVYNNFLRKATFLKVLQRTIDPPHDFSRMTGTDGVVFLNRIEKVRKYFLDHLTQREYTVYRGSKPEELFDILTRANPKISIPNKYKDFLDEYLKDSSEIIEKIIKEINTKKPVVFNEGLTGTSLNKGISSVMFKGIRGGLLFTIKIPKNSKALVLDYERIENVPEEEEIVLADHTKLKIESIKRVNGRRFEVNATVVN